jgi:hypothetical protein
MSRWKRAVGEGKANDMRRKHAGEMAGVLLAQMQEEKRWWSR